MTEPIYVATSRFGKGVFASRAIKKGERICVLRGAKMTRKDFSSIIAKGRDLVVDPLQINKNSYLDLDEPYVLINHSCNPNAGLKNGVELVAIKDLKKGDEIFYDYSSVWLDGFECKCGSSSCRGHIGDYYSIPSYVRKKYKKLRIVPNFIIKSER